MALTNICSPISPFLKIFLRRIFPSAVRSGDTILAGNIMEHGIHPDSFPTGQSPLAIAVQNNDLAMLELLCTAGATPKIRREDIFEKGPRRLPLWEPERYQILHMLLTHGADPDCFIVDEKKGFPLVDAALNGCPSAVRLLVQHGANVNSFVRKYHGTPWQPATYAMDMLSDYVADPNDSNGTLRKLTSLRCFLYDPDPHPHDFQAQTRVLVENTHSNEFRATDSEEISLQKAAMEGWIPVAIMLLQRGADVAATFEGRTAIDCAAERGRFDMLQLLLNAYQGSEDLRTVCNRAASYAQKEGHVEISEWLKICCV